MGEWNQEGDQTPVSDVLPCGELVPSQRDPVGQRRCRAGRERRPRPLANCHPGFTATESWVMPVVWPHARLSPSGTCPGTGWPAPQGGDITPGRSPGALRVWRPLTCHKRGPHQGWGSEKSLWHSPGATAASGLRTFSLGIQGPESAPRDERPKRSHCATAPSGSCWRTGVSTSTKRRKQLCVGRTSQK